MACDDSNIVGGGPKKFRFVWTPEVNKTLLEVSNLFDRQSSTYKEDLYNEFKHRIGLTRVPNISNVWRQLLKISKQIPEEQEADKRKYMKWTSANQEILLRVGMEAEALNERNKTIKFSDKLLELFLQEVPDYQGASDNLRQKFRELLTTLQVKDQKKIQIIREDIEKKLTEEDLARALDSEDNIPDNLTLINRLGSIGYKHSCEPMFKGVCSHCAKLLFGDPRSHQRWSIISRHAQRFSSHPFANRNFKLPIEEMYGSGVIPEGLRYKTDDNRIYICKVCLRLSAKNFRIEDFVNLRNPETDLMGIPPVLTAINSEEDRSLISLLGVHHSIDTRSDQFRRRYLHLRGEVNLLSKQDQAYRYMFGIMAGKAPPKLRKNKQEQRLRLQRALTWLREWNDLFKEFYANAESVFSYAVEGGEQIFAKPGQISTTKGTDIVEELGDEEEGYFLPADKNKGGDDDFEGDHFHQYLSHPKDPPIDKDALKKFTHQSIMSDKLEAMAFPCDFPSGRGSYNPQCDQWKKNVKHRDYCKLLLLHFDDRFRRNLLLSFFNIDRYIKMSLINHQHSYVAQTGGKAMEKPKADDFVKGGPDFYKQYGSTVAANIPGSRSYWWTACQELIALADEKKRHPDYFLTFTTNDNWPEIQSLLLPNHGPGKTCGDCPHRDQQIPSMQLPTLASIAFDNRWKKWCEAVLFKSDGELGKVETYWFRREYQKRGAVHLHGVVWVDPTTKKEGVVRATKPRTNSTDAAKIRATEKLRALVNKYQIHSHLPDRCFFRGKQKLSHCKYNFPAPLVHEERFDGVRKLYRRTKDEDKMVVPYSLSQLLIFESCVNIQEVNGESWRMYLPKYISKPEVTSKIPIGRTRLDKNATITERYMKMRVMGAVEVNDILLQFPMKICNVEVIYLEIPLDLENQSKVIRRPQHMPIDALPGQEYYDTKFEKYLKRPQTTQELRQITYPEYWRTFIYNRNTLAPTEGIEGEDIEEEDENEEIQGNVRLIDRHNRQIHRRRKRAVIRFPFLLPYGDDQERYCMKLLLENIAVDINSFPNELRPPGFTSYLNECIRRNLWDAEEIGLGFLQRAQELGVTEYDMRYIAGQLIEGNYLSKPQLQNFFESRQLQNLIAKDIQYPHNVFDDVDPNPDFGDYPVPRMVLLSLQEYLNLMNDEQRQIFDYISTEISEERQVLANIVGPAGTGKSFLIKALCALFKDTNDFTTNKTFSVLALTGSAAFNINGLTIHSRFKFDTKYKSHAKPNTIEAWLIRLCDVILIDEMSMIDKFLMEEIERNARIHTTLDQRGKLFGGKHIITFGDPAQLPSIRVPWFDGSNFPKFKNFVMKTQQRQSSDHMFAEMLQEIRVANVTEAVVDYFNKRIINELDYQKIIEEKQTVIMSRRIDVTDLNEKILECLEGDLYEFDAIDTDMAGNALNTTAKDRLMGKAERMADTLNIKIGSLVLIRRNINVAQGLVNGRQALVEQIHLDSNLIVLKSLDGKEHWPISRMKQTIDDYGENKYIRQQFPISLGWAATVHRVQGMTLDRAIVKLDASFFASGQAYVALSRTRRIEDLQLLAFDEERVYISKYFSQLLEWISKNDYLLSEGDRDRFYQFPIWSHKDKYIDPRKGDEEDEPEEEQEQRWDENILEEFNEELDFDFDVRPVPAKPVEDIFEDLKLSSQGEPKPKPQSPPIPKPQTQTVPQPGTSNIQNIPTIRRPNGVTTVEQCEDLLLQMIQQNLFINNEVIKSTFERPQIQSFCDRVLREIRSQLPKTYEQLRGNSSIEPFIQPIPEFVNQYIRSNFKLLNVIGNGDCFYSAVAATLYGVEKHQAIIRFGALISIVRDMDNWTGLVSSYGELASQICLSIATSNKHRDESIAIYCRHYKLDQRFIWAEQFQEMAVAVAINRSIDIFSNQKIYEGRFQPWRVQTTTSKSIAIYYNSFGAHFMALLPINESVNCYNTNFLNPIQDLNNLNITWFPLEAPLPPPQTQVMSSQPPSTQITSQHRPEPHSSAIDTTKSQKRAHSETSGSSDITNEDHEILIYINDHCEKLLTVATEDSTNKVFEKPTAQSLTKYFSANKELFDQVLDILHKQKPITVETIPKIVKTTPTGYPPKIGRQFKLVNVTGDGHCWYRAVALALFGEPQYFAIIRLGALYGVMRSFAYFEQFQSHYKITPSDLCLSIATVIDSEKVRINYSDAIKRIDPQNPNKYHWASNAQQLATSIAIDKPIDIFIPTIGQRTTFTGGRMINRVSNDNKKSIVIHYVPTGTHFMSLIPNNSTVLIKHPNILVRKVTSRTDKITYNVYPKGNTPADKKIKAKFGHIGDFHYEICETNIAGDIERIKPLNILGIIGLLR